MRQNTTGERRNSRTERGGQRGGQMPSRNPTRECRISSSNAAKSPAVKEGGGGPSFLPNTGQMSPDPNARRPISQGGAGGGGSMGHSRWRALRGYLIWSQKRLRTAAARKPGTRQMISSTDLNPAEAAVCKSREDPTAVRHGRPGLPCAQLDCAACVKAHKRAAWGCARACFSPALLATA